MDYATYRRVHQLRMVAVLDELKGAGQPVWPWAWVTETTQPGVFETTWTEYGSRLRTVTTYTVERKHDRVYFDLRVTTTSRGLGGVMYTLRETPQVFTVIGSEVRRHTPESNGGEAARYSGPMYMTRRLSEARATAILERLRLV